MKRGPKDPIQIGGQLYFPPELTAGDRAIYFFERYLTHVKGELAGTPLVLAEWQKQDVLRPLFSLREPDKLRQYRTCYVEVPRKNTKSTLGSGIALYLLFGDHEPGAEIVSAAADRDQARIVFDIARSMVESSRELKRLCQIYRYEIVIPDTGSRYRAISAEAYSKHGMNLSGAIVDEVHAHPNRELYDVLAMSMGSRRQPLTFAITTAGFDRTDSNLCWTLHQHAERVLENPASDPTFLPVIYSAPDDADWRDPKVWALANPGLGTSIKREYLEQECRRAQEIPSYQNQFRRFHLNQWTESETAWIPLAQWDLCAATTDPETLVGKECFGGLDLSTTTDLTAFVLVFPDGVGGYDVLAWAWCPKEGVAKRSRVDKAPYDLWVREGFLMATEGDGVDYDALCDHLKACADIYRIHEIGYDRWNSHAPVTRLQQDGAKCVPIGQGFQALSSPSKELERLVVTRKIRHDRHPVLRWCIGNTSIESDSAGNIKPTKKHADKRRIDLTVALVMALARATLTGSTTSIYETRGVVSV